MSPPAHFLSLAGCPRDRLVALLRAANTRADQASDTPAGRPSGARSGVPAHPLAGRTVATLFFEDSTRTRTSFALAATRLGAHVVDLSGSGTSISKGESLADTARTVEAMGVDAFIVRTRQAGGPAVIADAVRTPVINAGDGRREHPTQGLLDTLAVARAHGRAGENTNGFTPFDLSGLTIAIVGDAAHSRVARSDVAAMTTLGARVVLCGPPAMVPPALGRALGCETTADLDGLLPRADAVQVLRVQFERGARVASPRQYRAGYALTAARARTMKPGAVVMHPGPMNRGLEIDGPVADAAGTQDLPRSLILEQVRLGVAVRSAVLADLLADPSGAHPAADAHAQNPDQAVTA